MGLCGPGNRSYMLRCSYAAFLSAFGQSATRATWVGTGALGWRPGAWRGAVWLHARGAENSSLHAPCRSGIGPLLGAGCRPYFPRYSLIYSIDIMPLVRA